MNEAVETFGGINLEARMVVSEDNVDVEMANWILENLKFSVKHPVLDIQLFLFSALSVLFGNVFTQCYYILD